MYLSPEWMTIANQAVHETFENCSVAWQAIPHWETGDPAQTQVPADVISVPPTPATVLGFEGTPKTFDVTLAAMTGPTPNTLINIVNAHTVKLAADVDKAILEKLRAGSGKSDSFDDTNENTVLEDLIDARKVIENNGFRAPSCLIANTKAFKKLNELFGGYSLLDAFLNGANANSLHRVDDIQDPPLPPADGQLMLLGRRQLIAHGGAPDESPGEEPVDIAVSIPPSLEVVGENGDNKIAMAIRIRYALRIKDAGALVTLTK